jgi:hypothetical protein
MLSVASLSIMSFCTRIPFQFVVIYMRLVVNACFK